METTTVKIIVEHILFQNRVNINTFADECMLSKQTIYRALAGRDISSISAAKILRYFCYLQQIKT